MEKKIIKRYKLRQNVKDKMMFVLFEIMMMIVFIIALKTI